MNYKVFFEIILAGSSIGLGSIVLRKIPVLSSLSEDYLQEGDKQISSVAFEKIKGLNPFKNFSSDKFFQKVLTRVRILSLKTDNKTASLLKKIRENKQKKKITEDDNYWDEIRKATKG